MRKKSLRSLIESLESRQLLSGVALGFAPVSIAGSTVTAGVTTGTAPLETGGSYTLTPVATGTLTKTVSGGAAVDDAYLYFRTDSNTGVIQFADVSGEKFNDQLTFTSATAGNYVISPTTNGGPGAESGTFVYTAGAAETGPDLVAEFSSIPTGPFIAGDKATAIVSITNQTSVVAKGSVTVSLSVSSNGSTDSADNTVLKTITRSVSLKQGKSIDVPLKFTVPNLNTGDYFFVATAAPGPTIIDSDTSNNTSVSAGTQSFVAAFNDVSVSAISVTGIASTGAVSGTKATANVSIFDSGNQPVNGPVTINLYAADNAQGVNETSVLATAVTRGLHLKRGVTAKFPIKFTIPNVATATGEYFFATITPTNGSVTDQDASNNTLGTTVAINVDAPAITLSDHILGTLPTSVVGGSKSGRTIVRIANEGNTLFKGKVPVTVSISADTVLDDATIDPTVKDNFANTEHSRGEISRYSDFVHLSGQLGERAIFRSGQLRSH